MKGEKKKQLLEYIKKNEVARPAELAKELKISPQALHRHLSSLVATEQIQKKGTAPLVFYELKKKSQNANFLSAQLSEEEKKYLETNYSRLLPNGEFLLGLKAFESWLVSTKQIKSSLVLTSTFIKLHQEIYSKKEKNNLFNVSEKIRKIFVDVELDEVYCSDFYSLPQFGKTYLGNLITAGKSGQNKKAIEEIARIIAKDIKKVINENKIQAIAWAPHSIPRKIMFLNLLREILKINLPEIEIVKIFSSKTPIAQKSLSKLEDRITNARETTVIKSFKTKYQRILVIDDAIGSGATLNEIAKKIRLKLSSKKIIGYSIVASYKGFDVINVI